MVLFAEEINTPGILIIVDFEKIHDSISWNFLEIVLAFFNFGSSILHWIMTKISCL